MTALDAAMSPAERHVRDLEAEVERLKVAITDLMGFHNVEAGRSRDADRHQRPTDPGSARVSRFVADTHSEAAFRLLAILNPPEAV